MQYFNFYQSPLGRMTLASDGEKLTGTWFNGQKYDRHGLSKTVLEKNLLVFNETKHWLDLYFSGQVPTFTPALAISGTNFQKQVAVEMLKIPFGKTTTYGKIAALIAHKLDKKVSARAVGAAVGQNRIALIIPCHRVIGANGQLTGYAGGLERKAILLKLEKTTIKLPR